VAPQPRLVRALPGRRQPRHRPPPLRLLPPPGFRGLAYIPTSETARTYDLGQAASAFATEVLDPLGETWTLELSAILAWTDQQGLTRTITEAVLG
jgi:hypothetical protein